MDRSVFAFGKAGRPQQVVGVKQVVKLCRHHPGLNANITVHGFLVGARIQPSIGLIGALVPERPRTTVLDQKHFPPANSVPISIGHDALSKYGNVRYGTVRWGAFVRVSGSLVCGSHGRVYVVGVQAFRTLSP